MAERTTRRQVEAMAGQVMRAAMNAGMDVENWSIDYASQFGGWCIRKPNGNAFGGAALDSNRMPSGEFYKALRLLRDMLEMAVESKS